MRVQLIVVQGKSEGKTIPLVGPVFRIGRGETCHLRPNSERVSREHAEISLTTDSVTIRDLGSRNGTLVNGKALTQPQALKDRDLVQVGPLTFAVSMLEAGDAEPPLAPLSPPDVRAGSSAESGRGLSEPGQAAEEGVPAGGLRGGETILIPAFFESSSRSEGAIAIGDEADDDEYERHPIGDAETARDLPATTFTAPPGPAAGKKPSSTAAEILRKMMERRPVSK